MAYILKGDQSGTVRFVPSVGTITAESASFTNTITSSPLESGCNLNDHAVNDPITFSIGGTAINSAACDILEKMWRNRDIIEYQGKQHCKNLIIKSYVPSASSSNKNGFDFTMTLQQIMIVSSQTVAVAAGSVKNSGLLTTSAESVTTASYLDSVNSILGKKVNGNILSARIGSSEPGYAR